MRRFMLSHLGWQAIGVVSAAVIAVNANILVSRFYKRWDWTSAGTYTLSSATHETLRSLDAPIDVIVLLSRDDPLQPSVHQMLETYTAVSPELRLRYVDPDRNPGEFLAIQQKYDLGTGRIVEGRLVTDASLIIDRQDRHWFVTSDDLVSVDENGGGSKPHLEQALTEGIRNVLSRDRLKLCFTTGHQETSLDDVAPTGLAEFKRRLAKDNYDVTAVDLVPPLGPTPFAGCAVAVVVGPVMAFDSASASALENYLLKGGSALLLLPPVLDEERRLRSSGLESVARLAGVELGRDFVIETDPAFRLPTGVGESFFSVPKPHDVTRGLIKAENQIDYRVLVSSAQSLSDAHGNAKPSVLLTTSDSAFSIDDVRSLLDSAAPPSPEHARHKGSLSLAFATELKPADKAHSAPASRVVIVGAANAAWTRNWREPTLLGTRRFAENAVAWLAARPALVSVPEKPDQTVGLSLTQDALSEVWRYVLIYMPAAAALLGTYVMLRRRSVEKRSRAKERA